MTPLLALLLLVAAVVGFVLLPFVIALLARVLPLVIAIVLALAIYNWIT